VHVVPASADRPKTVTEPEQWVARRTPEQQIWPRTLVIGAQSPQAVLAAPGPENFGIEHFGKPAIKIALEQTFERQVTHDGHGAPAPVTAWPRPVMHAVAPDAAVLPAPAAHNFRYSRPFRLGRPDKPKLATKKPAASPGTGAKDPAKDHAKDPASAGSVASSAPASGGAPRPPRTAGHQLTVVRPPLILWPQWR
jgi:hypothetical protein